MRIAIIALGSQGDVQPYVALGKGLQAAGHTVRVLSHENFAGFVRSHGLEFWPLLGNVQEIVQSPEMRKLLEKGNFIAITAYTSKETQRAALNWAKEGLVACQGMDLLIAGMGGLYTALGLAEKLRLPFLQAYVVPFTPTNAFPGVLFPSLSRFGVALNRLSHHVTRQILWQGSRTADQMARQQVLDLPAASFWGPYNTAPMRRYPILYGFSPTVISKPADWGSNIHVTGYWFLDAAPDWTPPADLLTFLDSGPKPVYIGFGSMVNRNPEEIADLVLQALAKSGQRAIMMAGWGGLRKDHVPDTVYVIDSIPHAWLFPRVAAVIHHGGAGTTAAGLRAGVPSVVIPFFGDQAFWGKRIAALGVGPEPLLRKQLTAERLAQAIQQMVSDQPMRERAARLGAQIQAEDGIAKAIAVVREIEKRGAVVR